MIQIVDPFHPLYKRVLARADALGHARPSHYRQIRDNALIVKMIANGVWDDLDIFYNFWHDGSEGFSYVNWKDPNNFTLSKAGTITFTSLDGAKGNGSNGRYDTGWSPLTNGVKFTLNEASYFIKIKESVGATEFVCGASDTGGTTPNNIAFRPRSTVDTGGDALNITGNQNPSGRTDASGLWHTQRVNSSGFSIYRNGSSLATYGASPSTGRTSSTVGILSRIVAGVASGFSAKTASVFGAGASLNGKESLLNNLINEHQAA